jgi:hypothetical protein
MLPVRKPMTLAQFLTWEERQELRFEFDGVRPIERLSGTVAHAHIQTNLAVAIGGSLRASSCQFYGSRFKIQVARDHIRAIPASREEPRRRSRGRVRRPGRNAKASRPRRARSAA